MRACCVIGCGRNACGFGDGERCQSCYKEARDAATVHPPRLAPLVGYEPLAKVLDEALAQAQSGKGKDRHASGQPFVEQPIVRICEMLGSPDFALGQAIKKLQESKRLATAHARAERLGAINYIVASLLYEEGGG